MTQEAIQRRLHEAALAGRRAVRLKGGDPLVFGRGSEEADYLDQRLVEWELFPGVSAAQSAAAFAGLPLTERGRARSCSLAMGADPEYHLWTGADTQAFYMAGNALPRLAAEAEAHGGGDLPLAAVQGAASPWQSVTVGHYSGAAGLPRAGTDTAPVLYLGGPTVDGRAGNGWYDRQPRVLYTGLEPGRALKSVHVPYISVRPRPAADFAPAEAALLESALGGVPGAVGQADGPIDWLVFTSRITVERWFALMADRNLDSRALAGLRIASIGRATSAALSAHGIRPDLQPAPADEHSQGLAALLAAAVRPGFASQTSQAAPFRAGMGNSPGCPGPAGDSAAGLACRETARPHLLLPRSSEGLRLLPELLAASCFAVDELVLYHTVARTDDPGIQPEQFDRIVFSSPSGVKAFRRFHPAIPDRVLVELRGPQCRATFRELYPGHPDADAGFRPEADPIPEQGVSPA
jgi:siroheme synthase/uroporphyrinogen-III synthase